jgi:hypothetical protein
MRYVLANQGRSVSVFLKIKIGIISRLNDSTGYPEIL